VRGKGYALGSTKESKSVQPPSAESSDGFKKMEIWEFSRTFTKGDPKNREICFRRGSETRGSDMFKMA